jgi:hypothetical protein
MIIEKNIYILPMEALFYTLNQHRKINGLPEIEHSLIASKLGILFTLKNKSYINFKGEQVELYESQLIVLQEILVNYFNVEMIDEILSIAIKRPLQDEICIRNIQQTQQPKHKNLFYQIKGFLKLQEHPTKVS